MAEDVGRTSLARLLTDEVPIEPQEAVAIVRDVCDLVPQCGQSSADALTPGKVWLRRTGSIELGSGAVVSARGVGDLLEVLLFASRRDGSRKLPGPLALVVARAIGTMDAPEFSSCEELSRALARFDAPDRKQALEDLFSRWSERQPAVVIAPPPTIGLSDFEPEHPQPVPAVSAAPEAASEYDEPAVSPVRVRRPLPRALLFATAATGLAAGVLIALANPLTKDSFQVPPLPAAPAASSSSVRPPQSLPPGADAASAPPSTGQPAAGALPQEVPTTGQVAELERTPEPLVEPRSVEADAAYSPSFDPRGSAVFFHTDSPQGSALKRVDRGSDGTVLHVATILDDGARNYHVQLSPDGEHVAFDSDRDGERGVYVARPDGSGVRRVSGDGYAAMPRWSPDGRRLSLLRGEPDNPKVWNLWLLDVASGEMTRLTEHTYGQVWGGAWFPDGRRIAYSHEQRLIVHELSSGRSTIHESPKEGRLLRTPAVSPDGRYVIFQVFRDGAWLLDLTDGSMQRVLDDPSAEEFAWSPDGRRVAFHSRRSGEWGLWVMGR